MADFGFDPQADQVKQGDRIIFNKNVTAQSPNTLEFFMQNAAKTISDKNGQQIGAEITRQPLTSRTLQTLSQQPGFQFLGGTPNTFAQAAQRAAGPLAVGGQPQDPTVQQAAAPQQQILQPQLGESNDAAAQRAGFANSAEARQAGATFAAGSPQTIQEEGEAKVEEAKTLSPNTGVTTKDLATAEGAGANDEDTNFGMQDILDAIMGVGDTAASDDGRQALLDSQTEALDRIEKDYQRALADIKAQEASAIQETKDIGARGAGALSRILGRAGGFTTSAGGRAIATKADNLTQSINKLRDKANELRADAASAKASGDSKAITDTQGALNDLASDIRDQQTTKARLMLDFMQEVRLQQKANEVDPFFTGANLISIAKEIQVGTTQDVTDPNTGQIYSIEGLRSDDPTRKTIQSTNNATGEVTLTTYNADTGEVLDQQSAGKIGSRPAGLAPTSYREWLLAGGEEGTGKTFNEFIDEDETTNRFTATTVPADIEADLIDDIKSDNNFSLEDLIKAYPEVSSSYINTLYNNLKF